MYGLLPITRTCVVLGLILGAASLPAHADVIQLASPKQLGSSAITVPFTSSIDLLDSPYVVATPDNTLTFELAVGQWRRLDEGVNIISDFLPGTGLLYTNANNGLDLKLQDTVGGGGRGPADIVFAEGVRAVGFNAQTQVLGFETLTFSAFDDLTLLGTFSVSRENGQNQDDSASFLGIRATGAHLITRIALSSVVIQGGIAHEDDFFFGPISYRSVPEPSAIGLLCFAALGIGVKRATRRFGQAGRERR
jgi:hypothetical protein